MSVVAAVLFGVVAGLRTFSGEAVYFGLRGGVWGIVFVLAAFGEYAVDLYPKTPARTRPAALLIRCASGAFMGWIAARIPGALLGAAGALIGAFGGYRLRSRLAELLGAIPAGLLEDVLAIAAGFAAVTMLR